MLYAIAIKIHIFTGRQNQPTLNQIDRVEGINGAIKIIERVAARWKQVATRLHFEGHDIQRIDTDNSKSCIDACRTVFIEWLKGKGRMPITWETLINVLKEAGFSEIASDLEHLFN